MDFFLGAALILIAFSLAVVTWLVLTAPHYDENERPLNRDRGQVEPDKVVRARSRPMSDLPWAARPHNHDLDRPMDCQEGCPGYVPAR